MFIYQLLGVGEEAGAERLVEAAVGEVVRQLLDEVVVVHGNKEDQLVVEDEVDFNLKNFRFFLRFLRIENKQINKVNELFNFLVFMD